MRTIWKYPIDTTSCHEIEMPLNAKILCVQLQNNIPTLWALVETEEPKRIFDILTYCTDDDLIDKKGQYIGTYQLAGLVHHVFVRPHPASPPLNLSYIC
jgi:hypothetical protein